MKNERVVTLKEAALALNAPPHRIIHLCESDVVKPEVGASGRGTVRRFNADNLFIASVALRLQDAGLTVNQLKEVRNAFDWLSRAKVLQDEILRGGLTGAISGLTDGKRPVLLHVALSDFLSGSKPKFCRAITDAGLIAIECSRKLPQPPQSGIIFQTDDRNLAKIPVRVVVNLTQLCKEVEHGFQANT